MTWTKLGDEYPAEARELTSDEFRLHVEALCWSNKRLLDLLVPKRELRRLSELDDPEEAAQGLTAKGWWESHGDAWFVGVRFPEWQQDRAQVEHRREQLRVIQDRKRRHTRGDHSICLRGRCPSASPVSSDDTSDESSTAPGRVGTGLSAPTDPKSKALDQNQSQGQSRVGGGADDEQERAEAAPVKEGSATNSQNRRVRHGSETMADDAQESPPNRAERSGANRYAGTRERFGRTVSAGTAFDEKFAELRQEHERQVRELAEHPEAS